MNIGRFAFASNSAASSTVAASGATRREGNEPSVGSAHTSPALDRTVLHVEGQRDVRRPGRPVVIASNALRNVRGMSTARSSTAFHLVSGFISARWSSSVSVNRFPED